jgi:predicted membrane protein
MPHQIESTSQRNLVGIILLVLGVLFLLQTFDIMDFGHVFANWWPLIIVAVGVMKIRGQDKTGGAIILVIGLAFLSATLDIVNWGNIFRFWPVLLILIGVSMLVRSKEKIWWGAISGEVSEDFVQANAIFGGADQTITSENFKGGEAKALFGGVKLDLRQAKASEEGIHLNLNALFGGVEVLVPKEWQLSITGTPILGAIDNKTSLKEGAEKIFKVSCRCTVAFGAIEIMN